MKSKLFFILIFLLTLITAYKAYSQSAEYYFKKGVEYLVEEDYSQAMIYFNVAIEKDPELFEAYHNRGIVKDKLEDLEGALKDFDKAISIDNKRAETFFNRGYVKEKLTNFQGALCFRRFVIFARTAYHLDYSNRMQLYCFSAHLQIPFLPGYF